MTRDLTVGHNASYEEMISMIERSHDRAFRAVNRELISLYWDIGAYISDKVRREGWGKSVVADFAAFVQQERPEIRGFSAQNIWRMKQFYETYEGNEKLSAVLREISWTSNLIIMSRVKNDDAKIFYIQLIQRYGYSSRELERQIDSMLYERTMLSEHRNEQVLTQKPELNVLRDSYVLEFLDVPVFHREKDLRKAIVAHIRDFLLEFGKEFSFVAEEYRIQVGNKDFYIDLLLFNRALQCLVAIELKATDFKPEHLGQLEFYLEALDRNVKMPCENPSVGLILCAGKDDMVVEYALSRSLSPALVADYQLHLPNKTLLMKKFRELREQSVMYEGAEQ
jgi:hypothetical protein